MYQTQRARFRMPAEWTPHARRGPRGRTTASTIGDTKGSAPRRALMAMIAAIVDGERVGERVELIVARRG
jgi:hypothetical protein